MADSDGLSSTHGFSSGKSWDWPDSLISGCSPGVCVMGIHTPFVGAMTPLIGGKSVLSFSRPARAGGIIRGDVVLQDPDRYRICVTCDCFSYVVDCPGMTLDAVMAVYEVLPEPHAGNTHVCLSVVMPNGDRSGHRDAIVRVEAGDDLAFSGRPGDLPNVGPRPKSQSFYWLSDFGSGASITVYAHDLRFIGKVFDDGFGTDHHAADLAGGIRSLWIEDASDEISTNRSLFRLLRREARDPALLPPEMAVRGDEAFEELRDNPVPDSRGAILRIDVSPSPAVNFEYVTQPDPVIRAQMRERLVTTAIDDLLSRPTISFPDDGLSGFARFLRSRCEYWTAWADLPRVYLPPPGVRADNVIVFAESELGDGLPIWQEVYVNADKATASRFHVSTSSGIQVVGSSDAAAAVLYLDAQIARRSCVEASPLSNFNYESLAANGVYHGWDWTSFSFPDERGFHIRIRTVDGGFRSEFCGDVVHPSLEQALRASYDHLVAPLKELAVRPLP